MKTITCCVLNKQAQALEKAPFQNELGKKILEKVSQEGFQKGLEYVAMIINENGLASNEPAAQDYIYNHLQAFFFKEGPYANQQFSAPNPQK